MDRLDFHAACKIASDTEHATTADLISALNQLRSDKQLVIIAIDRIEREFKARMAARRAREMISELPADQRAVMQLKGMI